MLIDTASFTVASRVAGSADAPRVALVLPGRLDTKDYAHTRSHVDHLATRGFYALSFDPPGTWESPGSIDLFTTTNYLLAITELIEKLGHRPTLLLGHSRGGATAILASEHPDVFGYVAAMASYGPPSAPSESAVQLGYERTIRDDPAGGEREFHLPIRYFEDGRLYNPAAVVASSRKPKLIVYSTEDSFTEPAVVEQMYADAPEPKMKATLNCGHDYRFDPHLISEVEAAIDSFLDRYSTAT